MSILITGGAGYIGSHTCVELINAGEEIVVIDNLSNASVQAIDAVKSITGKDFPFFIGDVIDKESLKRIFLRHKIDAVIHFAGYKAVGESCAKPLLYYHNNIAGIVNLCEVMNEFGVKNIIFSSSATVYGSNVSPLTEDMQTGGCSNPYGRTKYMTEEILKDLHTADNQWNAILLRYFNPIGAHESGRIGEDPKGIPNNLMPFISQVAAGKREKLSIFGNDYETPDGTCVRDYIHVVDLARGHLAALKYMEKNENIGVDAINLGTGKGYSVLEIVNAFIKVNGIDVPYEFAQRRAGDLPSVYSDPSKAKRILDWCAERGLNEMCEDTWRWQTNNPNGFSY